MDKELKLKIKCILESFVMIISIFLLIIMSLYVPIIGILFFPISIVLLCLRHNKLMVILSISIGLIMSSIALRSILPLLLGFTYTTIGIVLVICIKKHIKFINTFCMLSLSVIIANLINLVMSIYLIMEINFWQFAQNIVANFNEFIKIYSKLDVDISVSQYIQSMSKIMTPQNILSVLPSIIIIFSLIISVCIYLLTEKILIKINYKINSIPQFNKWYFEPKLGAVLITIMCISMIMYSKNIIAAEYVYKTIYSLLQFFIVIIGISVINYFLKTKMKINKKLRIVISILVLISPLNILLPIIGLVDLISDIRGIDPNSLGTALRKKFSIY